MKSRDPQRSKSGKLGSQIKIFFFKRENGAVPKRQKRKDSQTEVAGEKKKHSIVGVTEMMGFILKGNDT